MPQGQQEDIGPSSKDWMYMYVFLFLFFGSLSVAVVCYCAFGLDVFFNFSGLHKFTTNVTSTSRAIYYGNVTYILGFRRSGHNLLCLYILCRDIIRHIDYIERLTLYEARDFRTARGSYECQLQYSETLMRSLKLWFTIHTMFFVFIVLSLLVEWISSLQSDVNFELIWFPQIAGSCFIAFKFAFPFRAASRVTTRFDKMFDVLNTQFNPMEFPEADAFLSYCKRCAAGFKLFGIRITGNVALICFVSSFVGFFKFYKNIF